MVGLVSTVLYSTVWSRSSGRRRVQSDLFFDRVAAVQFRPWMCLRISLEEETKETKESEGKRKKGRLRERNDHTQTIHSHTHTHTPFPPLSLLAPFFHFSFLCFHLSTTRGQGGREANEGGKEEEVPCLASLSVIFIFVTVVGVVVSGVAVAVAVAVAAAAVCCRCCGCCCGTRMCRRVVQWIARPPNKQTINHENGNQQMVNGEERVRPQG